MSAPHDCPIPVGQACPHSQTIGVTQMHMTVILDTLKDIKQDVRDLKIIAPKLDTHNDAIERAFAEIKKLDEKLEQHDNILNQFEGMKKLAMMLWTVLASGLGVVILKVFTL